MAKPISSMKQPIRGPPLAAKTTVKPQGADQRFFGAVKPSFTRFPPSFNPFTTTTTTRRTTSTTMSTTTSSTTTSTILANAKTIGNATDISAGFGETTFDESTYVSRAAEKTPQPNFPFDPLPSSTVGLCAPFPPCNPLGCGPGIAPVNCPDCNSAAVGFILLGMCLLAILIVFSNVLVIVVISRNESLRRRHGYIKMSLATADLLIGLLVIPASIYNLSTTLYLPTPLEDPLVTGRFFRPVPVENRAIEFVQENSLPSVFFGTILIISLIASIYNLLLLSADRLIAVAKPMQLHAGKLLSKKRLRYCLMAVWLFGLLLSSLPALIPSRFAYRLDGTTFYFIQAVKMDSSFGSTPVLLFSFFVMGVPYIVTVILNLATLGLTIKKLKFRRTYSSRNTPSDPSKRMKMLRKKFPEIEHGEKKKDEYKPIWKKIMMNHSNCNSKELSRDRTESNASTRSKSQSLQRSARELNTKVTKMILTMVIAFTVCMCPYIIVNISIGTGSLTCSNLGPAFNISIYLILFNSATNFFIYNLWHKEFRAKLLQALKRQPVSSSRPSISTSAAAMTSSNRPRYTSGSATFGRGTALRYHMKKKKNSTNSTRSKQRNEIQTHF